MSYTSRSIVSTIASTTNVSTGLNDHHSSAEYQGVYPSNMPVQAPKRHENAQVQLGRERDFPFPWKQRGQSSPFWKRPVCVA
jgi:hypothetical protein